VSREAQIDEDPERLELQIEDALFVAAKTQNLVQHLEQVRLPDHLLHIVEGTVGVVGGKEFSDAVNESQLLFQG